MIALTIALLLSTGGLVAVLAGFVYERLRADRAIERAAAAQARARQLAHQVEAQAQRRPRGKPSRTTIYTPAPPNDARLN